MIEDHLDSHPKAIYRGHVRAFARGEWLTVGFYVDRAQSKCYIRGRIPPSMRSTDYYLASLQMEYDPEMNQVMKVTNGFCMCPAGINFNCQHVGALMWTVFDVLVQAGRVPNISGQISRTSMLQGWGTGSGNLKESVSKPIEDYVFRKVVPKKKDSVKETQTTTATDKKARYRSIQNLYHAANTSCVGYGIDAELAWERKLDLQKINRAHSSGVKHSVDLSYLDSINWRSISLQNYPKGSNFDANVKEARQKRKEMKEKAKEEEQRRVEQKKKQAAAQQKWKEYNQK